MTIDVHHVWTLCMFVCVCVRQMQAKNEEENFNVPQLRRTKLKNESNERTNEGDDKRLVRALYTTALFGREQKQDLHNHAYVYSKRKKINDILELVRPVTISAAAYH